MFKQRPQKLVGDGYIRWCWPEWLRGRPVFPAMGEFMQRPWGTFKGSVKASVDTDEVLQRQSLELHYPRDGLSLSLSVIMPLELTRSLFSLEVQRSSHSNTHQGQLLVLSPILRRPPCAWKTFAQILTLPPLPSSCFSCHSVAKSFPSSL